MQIILWIILNISLVFGVHAKWRKKPHIVFILADDLGWNDVSFHGSRQIPTPNIDMLAANSIVLNNYYTQPLCTPSRAALMTSDHPIHCGLQYNVLLSAFPAGLSLNYTLLPQHLKKLGYKTHALGKWHLGFFKKEYTPYHRGFDSYLGYWTSLMDYWNHTEYEAYPNTSLPYGWGRVLRRNMDYADYLDGRYATTLFTEEAEKLIHAHNCHKPMFLYMAHLAVHGANPFALFEAPRKYVDKARHIQNTSRRIFAGMAIALDESIGKIFKALEKKRMLDNTIFIVSTDNGGETAGYRGGVGSNWPLRGNKGTTWEGGVRGTAFIWSPLLKKSPRISNQLMSIADWMPTLYCAAGGDPKNLGKFYGQNLWNALKYDKPSPRKELLHNIDPVDKVQSLRRGDYKIVIGSNENGDFDSWYGVVGRDNGISDAEYKKEVNHCHVTKVLKKRKSFKKITNKWLSQLNIHCKPQNEIDPQNCIPTVAPCLFNVVQDPCEQNNIADLYPELVEELKIRLQEYNATAVPLVNRTVDPRSNPSLYDDHWTNWADFI